MYSAAVDLSFGGGPNDANFKLGTAVGIRVANNLIHDAPRDAVLVSGQDNVFEYNEIFNCGFGSGDVGSFYSWLDWTIRGLVIRYNFIHDTVGGVNPDDGAAGNLVFGNVFAGDRVRRVDRVRAGPQNHQQHFCEGRRPGVRHGRPRRGARLRDELAAASRPCMDIIPTQPPWSVRFPEMTNLLASHPELPLQTKFERNLIVMKTGEPFSLKMSKARQADTNLFFAQQQFCDGDRSGLCGCGEGKFCAEAGLGGVSENSRLPADSLRQNRPVQG